MQTDEKISSELLIANKELVFQNEEKEKRATPLIISTIPDMTEHKQDDEYIAHLAAIVESSDDAIISKSLGGTIKSWNKGSEKMFGYTAKQAVGKHISLIIPPEYINAEKKILERIRKNEIIDHYETVRIKKSGEQFYVSLTVSPLKDRAGKIIGISKIARDITSGKRYEAELINANKELAFQNEEKEKRAAELIIANKELIFQNGEKEKRADELIIANKEPDTSEMKISLLLEAVYQKYGYDFRQYSEAHIRRRIMNRMRMSGLEDISQMQSKVLNDETFASTLIQDLSITVTEMFRDPGFYKSLRGNVIPILRTYPFIKIWHAGCSTGEEAYSIAIIMQEEGLYNRATIYATDFNQQALNQAKEGIFSNKMMKEYTTNYQLSGGKESFSNYYTSSYDNVIMNQSLKRNIVWANHNLVTDSVFAEAHLILCRNVLIYFDRNLQNKVQKLFYSSLINGGVLCLGSKESLRFTDLYSEYIELDKTQRIFKKKY